MYEGLSSKSHQKSSLPPKYKESEDLELFNHERTTDEDVFSYFLPLKGPDHYYLLMKFIEVRSFLGRWCTNDQKRESSKSDWETKSCWRSTLSRKLGLGKC